MELCNEDEDVTLGAYRLTHLNLAEYPEEMIKLLYPSEASELILGQAIPYLRHVPSCYNAPIVH